MVILANFYNVSTDYLLCLTENKNHPNTDLTSLRLSDETFDLLMSGSINNRLLCEIVTHYKFKELLADTEIYVDSIATSHSYNINYSLGSVKNEILKQNPSISEDLNLKTLNSSQINKEDFFCHITHKTWDMILKDIRKNHELDIESVPENNNISKIFTDIQKSVISNRGSLDSFLEIFCNSFGLKYKNLSEDERITLKNFFRKSPLIKNSAIRHRKRKKR